MITSIDIRGKLKKCTSDKIHTVWWAEIDGEIFKNSTGHPFFYRKTDLVGSLRQSYPGMIVRELAHNYLEFFEPDCRQSFKQQCKTKDEAFKMYWDAFVGETENHRVRICHYDIPTVITNAALQQYMRDSEKEAES